MTITGSIVGQKRQRIRFHFKCECPDCDADGMMLLDPKEQGTVACPEGCGAVYLPWQNPMHRNRWELKNVVMPHYGDPERGDYTDPDDE